MTDGNMPAESALRWTKSSYSSEEGGECLEVAAVEDATYVRDSKDTERPALVVGRVAWAAFLTYTTERAV